MNDDRLVIPPEALLGIRPGAAATLRREIPLAVDGAIPLYVDVSIPPDQLHVYKGGELVLKITNIS